MTETPKKSVCADIEECRPEVTTESIVIKGEPVGITGLDEIIRGVRREDLGDDEEISRALLERARERNHIPEGMDDEYRYSLLVEYNSKRHG